MAVYDTTNYIDTSLHLKSKLKKNFVTDNHWIESLQNKIDNAWQYASDVVDIEESIEYFNDLKILQMPLKYNTVEARLMSVYAEQGAKLSDDFKKVVFQNLKHPLRLGQKYKFDIRNFQQPLEQNKSVWLNVNFDTTNMGASAILRRCNGTIGFLIKGNTLEWYEPAIIENEFSYTNEDFNSVIKVAQDELYITVQSNVYTNEIMLNDRFIIGALNFHDISKNTVYKVKAVHRMGANSTFNTNEISLIKLVLSLDTINPATDLVVQDENGIHYIADYYLKFKQDGVSNIQNSQNTTVEEDMYYLKIEPTINKIAEGQSQQLSCYLYHNQDAIETELTYSFDLPLTNQPNSYYKAVIDDNNHITIYNLHKFFKSDLVITVKANSEHNVKPLTYNIQLGE